MGSADVLIILEDSPLNFDKWFPALMPSGIGVDVDVFPYTLVEAVQALKEGGRSTDRSARRSFFFEHDEKLVELFRGQRRVWGGTRSQGHHISA